MSNRKKKNFKKSINPLIFSLRCVLFPLAMTQANAAFAITEPTGQQDSFAKAAIQSKGSCSKSIALDGNNDWVNIPDMELSGSFTIEAWIKLAPGIDNKDSLLGQEGRGPDINFYGGKARMFVPFADHITAKTSIKPDTWTHIAITRSGSNLSLYINGILDSTGVWNGTFPIKALGRGNISSSGTFKGEMDEVRIWSIARSGKQINNSINQSVTPDSQGLVGYWTFNEDGQKINDSSKLGRHGTLGQKNVESNDDPIRKSSTAPLNETCSSVQNTTSETVSTPETPVVKEIIDKDSSTPGESCGMSLALDGKDDWINIPDMEFPGNFTIEAWAKLAPGIDNKDALVGQEGPGPDINFYSSKARLYVPFADHITASSAIRPDTWTHIALSRSGSNLSLYVNGVLDSIGSWNGKFPVKALGRGNVSKGNFQGELDEVRFWNIARSGSQINNNYNQSVAADSQGLVGYWTFNENGQAVTDSSQSGYHGALGASAAIGIDDPKHVKSSAPINENCDNIQNQAPLVTENTEAPATPDTTPTAPVSTVNDDNVVADQDSAALPPDSVSAFLPDTDEEVAVQGTNIEPTTVLYVSPQGNDNNSGTLASPYRTLAKARAAVQQIKNTNGLPAKGIAVVLRKGTYYLTESFKLGANDSGSAGKPVIYTSYPGEQAKISGAKALNSSLFKPVTNFQPVWSRLDSQARSKILYTDLKQQGISNFGKLTARSVFENNKGALQLYFDNKPMTLARWPDKPTEDSPKNHSASENGFTHINKALNNTSFTYTDARASRWTQAKDIWLHGFFKWNWADFHIPVNQLNTATKTMNVLEPGYGIGDGQKFYAYNLMEEITQPGEWYLDRGTGILYFWPPADIKSKNVNVSMLETNLIEMNNTSWITIKDVVLEGSRDSLVSINGGSNNIIDHSILRNTGNIAATITGTNSGIENSTIAYTGNGGVIVRGGNRVNLSAANNFVRNNEIHHFGHWVYGYKPAVKVEGVGQKISHNLMYQGPHAAVVWEGNEHLMEYNEIHDVARFSEDMGAFYGGRDWGVRGNVIRYNFIHHLYSWAKHGEFDVHGVYLDDSLSGTTVFGNVLYGIEGFGILNGGGRDNIMENNIFANCGVPLFTDNRGVNQINFRPNDSWNLIERIAKAGIDYKANPWASKYPELAAIPKTFTVKDKNNHWLHPEGNVYSRNISVGGNPNFAGGIYNADFNVGLSPISFYKEIKDNKTGTNPLFVNEAALNLNLKPNSPAFSIPGFKAIPFSQIGIQ